MHKLVDAYAGCTPRLVRFPNWLESQLGAQYPKNMGILIRTLPELSFGHALGKGDKNWISECLSKRFCFGFTPIHSLSPEIQPFYLRRPFATSFLITGGKGFVQFSNWISHISMFRICAHHWFDILMLLTSSSIGFVPIFHFKQHRICSNFSMFQFVFAARGCFIFVHIMISDSTEHFSLFCACFLIKFLIRSDSRFSSW